MKHYQELLFAFILREIRVRYRQTFLGVGWAIAQPLVFMVVLTGLKTAIFGETTSEGNPHQIFLYCAMVPWAFFQNSLTVATTSISVNRRSVWALGGSAQGREPCPSSFPVANSQSGWLWGLHGHLDRSAYLVYTQRLEVSTDAYTDEETVQTRQQ